MHTDPALIIALDFDNADSALQLAGQLDPQHCRLKVGLELFVCSGPALIEQLHTLGFQIFLDLKFHDIPNTVAGACRAAARLGVWMINVHGSGGQDMLLAARDALTAFSSPPLLTAVSILTSLDKADLPAIGLHGSLADNVLRLARLAQANGLDGLVCSPQEICLIREAAGQDFKLVTPGIRPSASQTDDQKRIMTPSEALQAGADYLVIGRPVTAAPDPLASLQAIRQSLLPPPA